MASVVVDVTRFNSCSPADFVVLITVEATVEAAVVAPKTLPECLRVCLRMTSEDVNILCYLTPVSCRMRFNGINTIISINFVRAHYV